MMKLWLVELWKSRVQHLRPYYACTKPPQTDYPINSRHVWSLPLMWTCWSTLILAILLLALTVEDIMDTGSALANLNLALYLNTPLMVFWWRFAVLMSEEDSHSRYYKSKLRFCPCSMCSHSLLRNGCVMTRHSKSGVPVTMVVQPLKHKCSRRRRVKFIVHNRDSRRVISLLLMLAGDVETNPGPLDVDAVDDTTILGSVDLYDVLKYLGNKQGKCYDIGSALRLGEDRLAKIQSEFPGDTTRALVTIIDDWLIKNYDTKRHGDPTWKALVKAVKSPSGGDDKELAEEIAKDHPAQPSEAPGPARLPSADTATATAKQEQPVNKEKSGAGPLSLDANSWAVRLTSGGSRAADELASKYGFINLGPIDDDPTIPENEQVYEFTRKSNSRSNLPKDVVDILTSDLLSEPKVVFAEYLDRTKAHLVSTVCEELAGVSHKWRDIGLNLGIPYFKLKEFEEEKNPLFEIIKYWLNGNVRDVPVTWRSIVAVLESNSVDEKGIARTIMTKYCQPETDNKANEEEAKKILFEAMDKGSVTSQDLVIVLIGIAGSGKSSFKRIALNLPPEEIRKSTPLAEAVIRNISVSRATVSNSDSIEWEVVDSEELLKMVADAVKDLGIPKESAESSFVSDASTSSSDTSEVEMKSRDQRASPQNESSSVPGSGSLDDALIEDLLKLITKSTGSPRLLHVNWVYIIDTGGQPQFLQLLPAFIKNISSCVCLLRLDQKLDDNPLVRYFDSSGEQVGEAYPSEQSNLQIVESCVRTIHSKCTLNSDKPPSCFIVGSHLDEYEKGECSESVEEKNERLLNILSSVRLETLMFYGSGSNKLIFPLNCKLPEERDHTVAAEFRKCVMSHHSEPKVKIPVVWFVLEEKIRQYATENSVAYVTRDKCDDIASQLHMSNKVFEAALDHLLKLNIFRRYSSAPNLIFCTTQLVLQMLTKLVQYSFQLRGGSIHGVSGEENDFKNTGKFSTKFLKNKLSNFFSDLFTPEIFLGILRELLAVADMQGGKHFMPSLLNELSDKDKHKHRSSSKSLSALLIRRDDGCLPNGLFTSLMVSLMNHCGWRLYECEHEPICLYQNCVTFTVPGNLPGTVTLIASFSYLEVHVNCSIESQVDSVCNTVYEDINKGLKTSWQVLYPGEVSFSLAFFCDSCSSTSPEHIKHHAIVSDGGKYETCSKDSEYGAPLCDSKLRWLRSTKFTCSSGQSTTCASSHHPEYSAAGVSGIESTCSKPFPMSGGTQVPIQLAAATFTHPYAVKVANIDDSTVLGPRTIKNQSVSFVIDSKQRDQVYSWEAAGLRIFLPDGPLPDEFDGKIIDVRTSTSKGFIFPPDTRIASAIFTIESGISMDVRLEMEHCCRGNLELLTFAVCTATQQFVIASNRQSFNSTHGIIETRHFSNWVILWRLLSSIACVSLLPEEIVVFPYYQVYSTCIKVNLVILKRLRGHIKAAREHYLTDGWKCDTPSGVCSARFSTSSTMVRVMLSPDWENIGNGWQLKPESPPQIDKSVIEANEEYFRSINLLFRWSTAATGNLDHRVTLEGLVIGDDPCYVNLVIDRSTASLSPSISSTLSRPNLESLSSFRGTDRTINVIEQIGTRYMDLKNTPDSANIHETSPASNESTAVMPGSNPPSSVSHFPEEDYRESPSTAPVAISQQSTIGGTQVPIQLAAATFTQEPDPYAVKVANIDDSTVLGTPDSADVHETSPASNESPAVMPGSNPPSSVSEEDCREILSAAPVAIPQQLTIATTEASNASPSIKTNRVSIAFFIGGVLSFIVAIALLAVGGVRSDDAYLIAGVPFLVTALTAIFTGIVILMVKCYKCYQGNVSQLCWTRQHN